MMKTQDSERLDKCAPVRYYFYELFQPKGQEDFL